MKGIREDLRQRCVEAYNAGHCLIANSSSDSRRLRKACERGDLVSPAKGVFALPEIWRDLKPGVREWQKLQALAMLHPDWVFSHTSAAVIHGLYVSNDKLGTVHVATERRSRSHNTASVIRHVVEGDVPKRIFHAKATSLMRTAFDCMRTYDFGNSLAIADSTLRIGEMTSERLVSALEEYNVRNRGARNAVDVARLANPLSENGGESIARAVMIEEGIKVPELQVLVTGPANPQDPYRVDFFWQLVGRDVAGELDGREKYRNPEMTGGRDVVDVLADERIRESRITCADFKVVRFSFSDLRDSAEFHSLLLSFGIPDGYAVPSVVSRCGLWPG